MWPSFTDWEVLRIDLSFKGLNFRDKKGDHYDKNLTGRTYELEDELRQVRRLQPSSFVSRCTGCRFQGQRTSPAGRVPSHGPSCISTPGFTGEHRAPA